MPDLSFLPEGLSPTTLVIAVVALLGISLLLPKRQKRRFFPAEFRALPLLNKSEARLFALLDPMVPAYFGGGARLMAQVSLGEFLRTKDRSAFLSINQRRVDFLVVDAAFQPLCAIEYQGSGHYGRDRTQAETAKHGDKTKRMALTSAGVALIEVPAQFDTRSVAALLASVAGPTRRNAA